ncbi:MAG: DJ/PfpI family protein [Planctomycetaceae bacterium]|nr:DJ/PfpI family protein [Planctomycetaceae bacterium]
MKASSVWSVVVGALFVIWSVGSASPVFAAEEPAWQSLLAAVDVKAQAVAGQWTKSEAGLTVAAGQGARLWLPFAPTGEYDVRIRFTRQSGGHSIALFFPHGPGQAAFEVDAWGEHLGGIQNIGGKSIRDNATRSGNQTLKNGMEYTMTVEARQGQIRALLDDQVIATHKTDGGDLSIPNLWALPNKKSLGIGAWDSQTIFHSIEARMLNGKPVPRLGTEPPAVASTPSPPTKPSTKSAPPATTKSSPPTSTKSSPKSSTKTSTKAATKSATGKRVLIVIANQDFFYREYADPRAELERAGFQVTVAAGRRAPCRPHPGSGQTGGEGIVTPDLALADVQAKDYDTMLFSGGWGSSAYQFAFNGRYSNPTYNGDQPTKAKVNQLINDFLKQGKYVCALCNAVSVLAWARVDGQSPLKGKTVCAPTRQAAPGIYNGQPAQPSCRWHPEANGAILSPAGALGRPGTAEDDVTVDGQIVTGEDDISARAMGRKIVELLSK